MRIAGLQMNIAWEDAGANLARASELAAQAASAGARLLVLPEMFATGFTSRIDIALDASRASQDAMAGMALAHGVYVAGGFVEPAPEPVEGSCKAWNTCVVYDPEGLEIARYRKIHAFSLAREHDHIRAGECLATAPVGAAHVTPLICYDLRFPEVFRAAARWTDLFVVIASWPEVRGHAWRTLLVARAIECQAWVLGVNRVGEAMGHSHRGDTMLVDPMGEIVASRACSEGPVLGEVDAERVAACRKQLGFLEDRRPELYAALEHSRPGRGPEYAG